MEKERSRLEKTLGGIKNMDRLHAAVFVVDPKKEKIAINEARKLGIPSIGIVDTNCNPEDVDYVIPGNDDAIRAIRLISSKIADAALEGKQTYEKQLQVEGAKEEKAMAASTPPDPSAKIQVDETTDDIEEE